MSAAVALARVLPRIVPIRPPTRLEPRTANAMVRAGGNYIAQAAAGSYAPLLTGFYVDNGPHLPLWDRLPHLSYWLLPARP